MAFIVCHHECIKETADLMGFFVLLSHPPVGKHGFLSSYNGIDNGTETEIQFFRRLFHTVLYPPLDHFHKTACNVVQKKFIGNILFLMI